MKHIEPKPYKAFKIDKIKFDSNRNSHLNLDVFSPVFLSKIICIAISHSSGVMVNTTFLVMDEVIGGFELYLNLHIRNSVKLIGHGGVHKHSCAVKSLSIQDMCFITTFLLTSLTVYMFEVKI